MTRSVTIDVGGTGILAFAGDRVLDALLLAGLNLPDDCRTGNCRICPVQVLAGRVSGGQTHLPDHVLACRALIETDLRLALPRDLAQDAGPAPAFSPNAVVADIAHLTPDVVEVTLSLSVPFEWRPGQYAHVTFEGFPARAFSPTVALDGRDRPSSIRLQIARLPSGMVSGEIGRRIQPGHRVVIDGPYGSATLEPNSQRRLVLLSSGTGFAPLWAIADAALRENSARRIVMIAGAQALENLYMAEALERMSLCPGVSILPVTVEPQAMTPIIRCGSPLDFASMIAPDDVVHAAGPAAMVQLIGAWAAHIGARFHADPFVPSATSDDRWLAQAARRFAARPAPAYDTIDGRARLAPIGPARR